MKKFSKQFEYEVFGYLFYDKDKKRKDASERVKAERLIAYMPEEVFDNVDIRRLYKMVKGYAKKHNGQIPRLTDFRQQIYNEFSDDIGKHEIYNGLLQKCLDTVDHSNIDYIRDDIKDRVKHVLNQKTVEEIVDIFHNNSKGVLSEQDYAKIQNRMINTTSWDIVDLGNVKLELDDDDFEKLLSDDYRQPVPTGIDFIDEPTNGGLGKGELGIILAPKGIGKTTFLTKIANSAYNRGMNVLHIVFEDRPEEIQRKHLAIWSKLSLNDLNHNMQRVKVSYREATHNKNNGLYLQRLPQGSTTVGKIRSMIRQIESNHSCKIDTVVIDYVDCLAPDSGTNDKTHGQEEVIRAIESMCFQENVSIWTAVQSNREGFDSEKVTSKQMGGSIARAVVGHFVLGVNRTDAQKGFALANAYVDKCRFGDDKILFENIYLNNKSLVIQKNTPDGVNTTSNYQQNQNNTFTQQGPTPQPPFQQPVQQPINNPTSPPLNNLQQQLKQSKLVSN